jgi:hypothetical protein
MRWHHRHHLARPAARAQPQRRPPPRARRPRRVPAARRARRRPVGALRERHGHLGVLRRRALLPQRWQRRRWASVHRTRRPDPPPLARQPGADCGPRERAGHRPRVPRRPVRALARRSRLRGPTKRQTGVAVCLIGRETSGKCGKTRTRPATAGSRKVPANQPNFSGRTARLKIVVSPVRVRVSPSQEMP